MALTDAQLNRPVLSYRCHAGGQTARQADEQQFDRSGALIFGGEQLRVVPLEHELGRGGLAPRPRPKKPLTVLRLWVPCTQVLLTRHLKWAPSG